LRNKLVILTALIFALTIAVSAFAEDMGRVTIPTKVKLRGVVLDPGTYTFAVEKEGEVLVAQLKMGGEVIASEMAITKPAEKAYDSARIAYQTLKRDGKDDPVLSRIFCSYRGTIYLLYFEKP